MANLLLEKLTTIEFLSTLVCSTFTHYIARLKISPDVKAITEAYNKGTLCSGDIEVWVRDLLKNNKTNSETCFPYEEALGAIAVALAEFNDKFANEYINELANLNVRGFEIASGIAKGVKRGRAS